MYKIILITIFAFSISGCALKQNSHQFISDFEDGNGRIATRESTTDNQLIYNNNFEARIAKPRKIWFPPEITKNNIVSGERTIILPPKKIIWTNKIERRYDVISENEVVYPRKSKNSTFTQDDDFDKSKIILPSNISNFIKKHREN